MITITVATLGVYYIGMAVGAAGGIALFIIISDMLKNRKKKKSK